jgi:carbon-monoxide dehydrogenase large subunit
MPGVLQVMTGADLPEKSRTLPLRTIPLPDDLHLAPVAHPLLALGRALFAGQAVAAVLAESPSIAADAAEQVLVDYEPLHAVTGSGSAPAGETALHQSAPDNVLLRWRKAEVDTEPIFSRAANVVGAHFEIPRLVAAPIEPRGCLATYDAGKDLLTLTCSSQDAFRPLYQLCAVLGRPQERTRVVVPDVGGGFGSKGGLAPEHAVACLLAMQSGRPVKWVETRSENFLSAYQGRGMKAEAELALDADSRFLALRVRLTADLGAFVYPHSVAPLISVVPLLTGVYDIPAAAAEVTGVASNKVPTGPYRGAGRPEATYIIERLVDVAAKELGIDPAELRRRNLIPPGRFPYRTPLGSTYDSGDYPAALERACQISDYESLRKQQRQERKDGKLTGIGLSVFVESAGAGMAENALAELSPDGRVIIWTGSSSHGQGHQTAFAQIAADRMGLTPEAIDIRQGDSAALPAGIGTYGSRSLTLGGSAVAMVVDDLKARARKWAAHMLEVAEADLRFEGGRFSVAGAPTRTVGLAELASAAHDGENKTGRDELPELTAQGRFTMAGLTFPSGAYVAVVEIERDTGRVHVLRLVAVDDAGTIVNPLLSEGQVVGGAAQGIAEALFEEVVYDEGGQLASGSFISYLSPAAPDLDAEIQTEFLSSPSPLNPLGAKGIGESGSIAVPAAVANAVADGLGVRDVPLPLTPERVWRLANPK